MRIQFIFHRPDMPCLSPAVSLRWDGDVIDILNRIPGIVWANGNMPEGRCVDFIGACFSIPEIDKNLMEVCNVALPQAWFESQDPFEWYRKLIARETENSTPEYPIVLVNLSPPYDATVAGKEICRLNLKPTGKPRPDDNDPIWIAPKRTSVG